MAGSLVTSDNRVESLPEKVVGGIVRVLSLSAVFDPHTSNSGNVCTSERVTPQRGREFGQKIGRPNGDPITLYSLSTCVWIDDIT